MIAQIARSIFKIGSLPKVSEIYSARRLIEMCKDFGLAPGMAYDLEARTRNGKRFDLSDKEAHDEGL